MESLQQQQALAFSARWSLSSLIQVVARTTSTRIPLVVSDENKRGQSFIRMVFRLSGREMLQLQTQSDLMLLCESTIQTFDASRLGGGTRKRNVSRGTSITRRVSVRLDWNLEGNQISSSSNGSTTGNVRTRRIRCGCCVGERVVRIKSQVWPSTKRCCCITNPSIRILSNELSSNSSGLWDRWDC